MKYIVWIYVYFGDQKNLLLLNLSAHTCVTLIFFKMIFFSKSEISLS